MKIKVFEAFAGYGSQAMALERLKQHFPDFDYEVVGISEIDKYALQAYQAVHGHCPNYGDISKVDWTAVPDFDLLTYSFPCTDISIAGQQKGFKKGSGTRSSLLWECQRAIETKRPKYLLMENVSDLLSQKFFTLYKEWREVLGSFRYSSFTQILNARDFGIPQNRERAFMASIFGDCQYHFPRTFKLERRLKDILEDDVDEKYYLSNSAVDFFISQSAQQPRTDGLSNKKDNLTTICLNSKVDGKQPSLEHRVYDSRGISTAITTGFHPSIAEVQQVGNIVDDSNRNFKNPQTGRVYSTEGISPTINTCQGGGREPKIIEQPLHIREATAKGYAEAYDGDSVNLAVPSSQTRRGRAGNQIANTLDTGCQQGVVTRCRIRKLTPRECFRLMDVSETDIDKLLSAGISNSQLYKLAGNSICVGVLFHIMRKMFCETQNEHQQLTLF